MANTYRYIARIILKAKTGLFVGSGDASLLKDAIVQKDHRGLPMIQGTSLTGVLSHAFLDSVDFSKEFNDDKEFLIKLWGHQLYGKEKEAFEIFYQKKYPKTKEADIPKGYGSRLKISSAYLLNHKNEVAEGLEHHLDETTYNKFDNLPARQHVKITDKGVAKKNGLFNNEVVYAGSRFIFEIELSGNEQDKDSWEAILNQLYQPNFRIGQGTRNGYGSLEIESIKTRIYNLKDNIDFVDYLAFNPSFNAQNKGLNAFKVGKINPILEFHLSLTPDSFFIFSSGSGDEKADNKPVEEDKVIYEADKIAFVKYTLIPASSIKGAIAHRTAFHYNKLNGFYAGSDKAKFGNDNEAVRQLFGFEAKDSEKKENEGQRGFVTIDDFYFDAEEAKNEKLFNHVAIDRFTGGAMDGALFSEKVSNLSNRKEGFKFSVFVSKADFEDENIIKSLEDALKDICKGLLPLGGMTNKGHGIFTGKLLKNGTEIYRYEN